MRPVLLEWRGLGLRSYPALLYLGTVCGVVCARLLAERTAVDTANTDMATYARTVRPATTDSPSPAAAARPLYIGMGAPELTPPRFPFLGRLQEIAFYDLALTPSQVSAHVTASVNF